MKKPKKKLWLAVLLSLLTVGMGQIYNKKYKEGILLFIVGITFSLLVSTNYWFILISFPIWLYSIYDAYKTAKKTINQEPYKNAVWIAVIIFMGFFFYGFWYGGYYGNYTQANLQNYEEIRQRLTRESDIFLNKLNEASLSFNAQDTVATRNKISESKTILIDLKNDYEFICSFQENNRGLFPNVTDSNIKECKAYLEFYKFCYSKWLDSFYSLTYLLDQSKQIKIQQDTNNYRNSCNSWLNNYNVVRGSCNTIIEVNKFDVKQFEDFSYICKV